MSESTANAVKVPTISPFGQCCFTPSLSCFLYCHTTCTEGSPSLPTSAIWLGSVGCRKLLRVQGLLWYLLSWEKTLVNCSAGGLLPDRSFSCFCFPNELHLWVPKCQGQSALSDIKPLHNWGQGKLELTRTYVLPYRCKACKAVPNHLQKWWLNFLSIPSTDVIGTSYTGRRHRSLWNRPCW